MAISEAANNVIGGIGGFVLAACLLPQLMRLYITRSAFDLSYFFLVFFIIGLIFTCLYMVNVDALVGYISVIVEGLFAICMLLAKIYLDNWGPYAKRNSAASGLTIPARARLEMSKFLSGTAGAPFPKMMQAEESHVAAHLLLDCQLEANLVENNEKSKNTKNQNNAAGQKQLPSLSEVEGGILTSPSKSLKPLQLSEFVDMLENCLDSADLDVYKRQTHAFASFKQRQSASSLLAIEETMPAVPTAALTGVSNGENNIHTMKTNKMNSTSTTATTTSGTGGGANLCFIPCKDGYCSAMWLPESSTLAVDLVGAAPETIQGMNTAAEMFCRELQKAHPGVKIVASAVSRLPAL